MIHGATNFSKEWVTHFYLDTLDRLCTLCLNCLLIEGNIAQKVGLYIISLTHSYQNTYNIYIISHFSICIETIMQFCLNSIISQHLTDCMNINVATRVEMQSSSCVYIKISMNISLMGDISVIELL